MASLPHPVQSQGNKRNLAAYILRFLPSRVDRLVEPFSGTAAISIAAAAEQSTQFSSLDYKQVLAKVQTNDFVYMDPPYQGVCGNKDSRYFAGIYFEDFVIALEHLNERGISFAISYDGRLGNKTFGRVLPESLGLKRIEIEVGRSSQLTLLTQVSL